MSPSSHSLPLFLLHAQAADLNPDRLIHRVELARSALRVGQTTRAARQLLVHPLPASPCPPPYSPLEYLFARLPIRTQAVCFAPEGQRVQRALRWLLALTTNYMQLLSAALLRNPAESGMLSSALPRFGLQCNGQWANQSCS